MITVSMEAPCGRQAGFQKRSGASGTPYKQKCNYTQINKRNETNVCLL